MLSMYLFEVAPMYIELSLHCYIQCFDQQSLWRYSNRLHKCELPYQNITHKRWSKLMYLYSHCLDFALVVLWINWTICYIFRGDLIGRSISEACLEYCAFWAMPPLLKLYLNNETYTLIYSACGLYVMYDVKSIISPLHTLYVWTLRYDISLFVLLTLVFSCIYVWPCYQLLITVSINVIISLWQQGNYLSNNK
jgi:hypothetical protein